MNYDPTTLADADFAAEFPSVYDRYAELRADGTPSDLAVIEAFQLIKHGVNLGNAAQLGMACDVNPYVRQKIKDILAASDMRRDLWPQYRAVHTLLKMVEDPRVRDATRLNAVVQLNVLCGYITLDGQTQRKVQQTIAEFERQNREYLASINGAKQTH